MKKLFLTGLAAWGLSAVSASADVISEAQAELSARGDEETVSLLTKKIGEEKAWYVPDFTWSDLNVNYLDWSGGTENLNGGARYADFWYAELEGGAGWSWGDFYFFTDLENPGKGFDAQKAPDDSRWVIKPILDINLAPNGDGWVKNLQLHIQDYYLYGDAFYVNNLVVGVGYKVLAKNFFARPFVGFHHTKDKYNPSRWNGYMVGWVFNYDFTVAAQKFALSNWHEFEFGRDDAYGDRGVDGGDWGVQGALVAWWHATKHITAGLQYRYAYQKLGQSGYIHGWIYTLKYNF